MTYSDALCSLTKGKRHTQILGVANLGFMEGIPASQIIQDIKWQAPDMEESEISEAVRKAETTHYTKTEANKISTPPQPRQFENVPAQAVQTGNLIAARDKIVLEWSRQQEDPRDVIYLLSKAHASDPGKDAALLLKTLFKPDDIIFIGNITEKAVLKVADWQKKKITDYAHISVNTFTGEPITTKDGRKTFRSNDNILKK